MEPTSDPARASNILIVDDLAANLQVLSGILKKQGHKVRPVPSGRLALSAAESCAPDLILLDVLMPEMDGYEVCRRLKAHQTLRQIPVIFISALDDTADKVKGFEAGGVDYITKPFQSEEVLARVDAHLNLHFYRHALEEKTRQLETSYGKLESLENLRDQLTHMIVHDMRNLLTGVGGFLMLLGNAPDDAADDQQPRLLQMALRSVNDLTAMTTNLLDVSKLESKAMTLRLAECDAAGLVGEALERLEAMREARTIRSECSGTNILVRADHDLVLRIIINLVDNAIKFTPANGTIVIGVEAMEESALFSIRDNGPGIPIQFQETIFEKFAQLDMWKNCGKSSTGLGLTFCKLAVEAHRGKIWVDSKPGDGSTFYFQIPGRTDHA